MPSVKSAEPQTVSRATATNLIGGTSALGMGVIIERGLGFLANALAARLGGAATFGAYSLAITTANSISSYAAGGIGSTAIRFSARYPRDTEGYATIARVLLIIAAVSASVAAFGLWTTAAPIARLLGRDELAGLLRWAALSAAGMILLECCRGFLVGQRRIAAILLLSSVTGLGMLSLLPAAALSGPVAMIAAQGTVALVAVCSCLLLSKPLGLWPLATQKPSPAVRPMLKLVWSFGLIQLAGLVGMNAAGWWLTSLIVKADSSMVQMGYFAVAHQLRNLVALAPSLLTESSLAVMAQGEGDQLRMPDHVMAACTFMTTFASLLLAGLMLAVMPWALPAFYGHSYTAASAATAVALATAVIHMSGAPAAARLSIVSIRLTGVINTIWAGYVAAASTVTFLWLHDSAAHAAWEGAAIYLSGHLLTSALTVGVLVRRDCVPPGMVATLLTGATTVLALAALAFMRELRPEWTRAATVAIPAICALSLALLVGIGRTFHWVPSMESLRRVVRRRSAAPDRVEGSLPLLGDEADVAERVRSAPARARTDDGPDASGRG